ncbi:protein of unknown function [Pseudomonas grimontii]|uniref:DUF4263 domain-containing protein n=1 Tax=Pseudomonas grimontii TaxID=129847 RepID=A0A1H1IGW6_9PSED|nr:Shedu anti-phage system protein SduA domain-containing protein [Pseudomonas grimontii]TWR64263.1 DUF4263 domain-containing protein [Pseudomonas grimontii]SDR36997.1 protein of unknown function [Pseudomonas grimontii]
MLFDKFAEKTKKNWTSYFTMVSTAQKEGRTDSNGKKILYPNILLLTQCKNHYIAELIGANEKFQPLTIKIHKEASILRYLGQFDDTTSNPIFYMNAACNIISQMCLSHPITFEATEKRFPHLALHGTKMIGTNAHGSTLAFGKDFTSCSIDNCTLLNHKENTYRCKSILSALIVKKSITNAELEELFNSVTKDKFISGVHTVSDTEQRLMIASQLQNLYLSPGLRETTIGEFLKLHPEIIKHAFNSDYFEYEPSLEWLEHDGTCTDTEINPDLLIKREDGYFDICDLKTAKLDKKKITKASRSRRRFIDYVAEGMAQLANYREYFKYPKNAGLAKKKYGIEVNNPRLILVVGSWDNLDADEVNQACRQYTGIDVIDYDTLSQLYIYSK